MISRRTFMTISIVMGVIFFLFMFSQASRQSLSDYMYNQYAYGSERIPGRGQKDEDIREQTGTCVYIGAAGAVKDTVSEWCGYRKYNMAEVSNVMELSSLGEAKPELILVQGDVLADSELEAIYQYVRADGFDGAIVFLTLPDAQKMDSNEHLKELFGVSRVVSKDAQVEGYWLLDGFLVGGEYIYRTETEEDFKKYQDLDLQIPWYELGSGTKTYMMGFVDGAKFASEDGKRNYSDGTLKREFWPGVVWRNSINKGRIFAINGDYMSSNIGLGFLSAIESEADPYVIYPIVNSMNLVVANFPTFTQENSDKMHELYVRDTLSVERDIIWPSVTALAAKGGFKPTFMLNTAVKEDSALSGLNEHYQYFMRLVREESSEAGIVANTSGEHLKKNYDFLQGNLKEYLFQSAYAGTEDVEKVLNSCAAAGFQTVSMLLTEYDEEKPLVGAVRDGVVCASTVSEGVSHTFSEDLRERSIMTALGYSTVFADLSNILYPESKEDEWQSYSKLFAANTDTFFEAYKSFDHTTVSEAGARISDYLNASYSEEEQDDVIKLKVSGGEGYYLLRTNNKDVSEVRGAEYVKIEKDVYLLAIRQSAVEIKLKATDGTIYAPEQALKK